MPNNIYHCLPEPSGPPANIIKRGIILAVDHTINGKESELSVQINFKNEMNQNVFPVSRLISYAEWKFQITNSN